MAEFYTIKVPEYSGSQHVSTLVTATEYLPPRYEYKGNFYTVIMESRQSIVDGEAQSSHDLDIAFRGEVSWGGVHVGQDMFSKTLTFALPAKSRQNAYLNAIAKKVGAANYRSLAVYDRTSYKQISKPGLYIVKPELGARAIGQIVFEYPEVTPSAIEQLILGNHTLDGFLDQLKKRNLKAQYHSPRDHSKDEGYAILREARLYSEYLTNVSNEYRLTTGADSSAMYCTPRYIKTVSDSDQAITVKQATVIGDGSLGPTYRFQSISIDQPTRDEINSVLNEAQLPLHSIDLFFTSDGKWGIFEYSTSFCCIKIPSDYVAGEIKEFIHRTLND